MFITIEKRPWKDLYPDGHHTACLWEEVGIGTKWLRRNLAVSAITEYFTVRVFRNKLHN